MLRGQAGCTVACLPAHRVQVVEGSQSGRGRGTKSM